MVNAEFLNMICSMTFLYKNACPDRNFVLAYRRSGCVLIQHSFCRCVSTRNRSDLDSASRCSDYTSLYSGGLRFELSPEDWFSCETRRHFTRSHRHRAGYLRWTSLALLTKIKEWVSHKKNKYCFNPLKAELNPMCHLLALLGAHHILHISRIKVKFLPVFSIWQPYFATLIHR